MFKKKNQNYFYFINSYIIYSESSLYSGVSNKG